METGSNQPGRVGVNDGEKLKDEGATSTHDEEDSQTRFAVNCSWVVNWLMLLIKIIAFIDSLSKAVAAAMADSVVDLLSQGVLYLADTYSNKPNSEYPIGRSRLEALSVLATAAIMSMASVEIIQFSATDIYDGFTGTPEAIEASALMYSILAVGIGLKLVLYLYCKWVYDRTHSDSLGALAEDHLNDVMSNIAALITAAIASSKPSLWWFDPVGAVAISVVIMYRWFLILGDQIKKIVGFTAPQEFLEHVKQITADHDARLELDKMRAYHFGSRFNVEVDIILPGHMPVRESQNIALDLQHKIEMLPEVERAYVHVYHEKLDGLVHKVDRRLINGSEDIPQRKVTSSVQALSFHREAVPQQTGTPAPVNDAVKKAVVRMRSKSTAKITPFNPSSSSKTSRANSQNGMSLRQSSEPRSTGITSAVKNNAQIVPVLYEPLQPQQQDKLFKYDGRSEKRPQVHEQVTLLAGGEVIEDIEGSEV